MKVAFSTLGCPGWSWEEIFATAKDLGMDGIEIRGIGEVMYAPKTKPFLPEQINQTIDKMKKAKMTFTMLTSAADLSVPDFNATYKEAQEYIDLAEKIGCQYVRILPENSAAPSGDVDIDMIAERYAQICDYGKEKNVLPLIETAGVLADSKKMSRFIQKTNRSNAFVLWDIHHPYRYLKESPKETYANLEGLIKYLHVKDSVMEEGKTVYRMMGYGDVPVLDCLKIMVANGYDGVVSLEWIKRWAPDLQEPGIVFSHYVNYMRYLINQI